VVTENEIRSQADVSPSAWDSCNSHAMVRYAPERLSELRRRIPTNPMRERGMPSLTRPVGVGRIAFVAIIGLLLTASAAYADAVSEGVPHVAWSLFGTRSKAVYDSAPGNVTPHPAVARIIVPEDGSTAFGSGTLVGVNKDHGLVITNWHVVRDGVGLVEVVFPDGFRSNAKPLKVDSDWDLAALVIWRPKVEPVKIATQPPRQGDLLTIHGYGRGQYRIATGHCSNYFSPRIDFPHEMVELDVEARQGDSGGPIFNQSGELAGVLFGAGEGTTLGSFAPRVRFFLASAVPDFEQSTSQALVAGDRPAPTVILPEKNNVAATLSLYPSSPWSPPAVISATKPVSNTKPAAKSAGVGASAESPPADAGRWHSLATTGSYDLIKTLLAAVGLTAITLRLLKTIR
jgi:S1-C subfamily serine protease